MHLGHGEVAHSTWVGLMHRGAEKPLTQTASVALRSVPAFLSTTYFKIPMKLQSTYLPIRDRSDR